MDRDLTGFLASLYQTREFIDSLIDAAEATLGRDNRTDYDEMIEGLMMNPSPSEN